MSPLTLTPRAQELLDDMPPYWHADPTARAVIQAFASEAQRIEETAAAIRDAVFPSQAADTPVLNGSATVAILSMWEMLLDLPMNPAGVTTAERRSKVLARIQKRNSGAGSDWIAALTASLGTLSWTHTEGPGSYQVTIRIPYGTGSFTAGQVLALARLITPAHIDVTVGYDEGFLVGISAVGVDAL